MAVRRRLLTKTTPTIAAAHNSSEPRVTGFPRSCVTDAQRTVARVKWWSDEHAAGGATNTPRRYKRL